MAMAEAMTIKLSPESVGQFLAGQFLTRTRAGLTHWVNLRARTPTRGYFLVSRGLLTHRGVNPPLNPPP